MQFLLAYSFYIIGRGVGRARPTSVTRSLLHGNKFCHTVYTRWGNGKERWAGRRKEGTEAKEKELGETTPHHSPSPTPFHFSSAAANVLPRMRTRMDFSRLFFTDLSRGTSDRSREGVATTKPKISLAYSSMMNSIGGNFDY